MFPTPDLHHLTARDYELIYEPAEDTFILLDALEQDIDALKSIRPIVCLEIGSGSGCVSTFVSQILGPTNSLYLCTDINSHAARCTTLTGKQNHVHLEALTMSLCDSLMQRLTSHVDILLFNPPYVPTFSEEAEDAQETRGIQGAWAGGLRGMEVTDQVLDLVGRLLSDKGVFYLVAVKENDIQAIRLRMLEEQELHSEIILQRRAGREHLYVLKFRRKTSDRITETVK